MNKVFIGVILLLSLPAFAKDCKKADDELKHSTPRSVEASPYLEDVNYNGCVDSIIIKGEYQRTLANVILRLQESRIGDKDDYLCLYTAYMKDGHGGRSMQGILCKKDHQ